MKRSFSDNARSDLRTKTARQTLSLYGSRIALIVLGAAIATLHARILGPKDYGILSLYVTVTMFVVMFFRFGFFESAAYILARSEDEERDRRLIGSVLVVTLAVGLSYALAIFGLSFVVDRIFSSNVRPVLLAALPLLFILPFEQLVPQLARGTNQIGNQVFFNLTSRTLYLASFVTLILSGAGVTVVWLVILQLVTMIAAVVMTVVRFRPTFSGIGEDIGLLCRTTRSYGLHVYMGQVANQTTYRLDGIFITFFVNTTVLGFYSLASAVVSPMALFSQSLAASLFKGYAKRDRIPQKVFRVNTLWLVSCVVGLALLGGFLVRFFFGEEFAPVTPLILPLAIAGFFQGMYAPYSFLAAKGQGRWIKNTALVEGAINVVGNVVLIYLYGAMGAAIASAIAKFVHWRMLAHYYNRYIRMETPNAK